MVKNYTLVALPDTDDPVWDISSEKVPHLTILFLGDLGDKVPEVWSYIQFAAKLCLHRTYLSVGRRGTLGDKQADVLFFKKDRYGVDRFQQFMDYLLKDSTIYKAHQAEQQYPTWTPHLTLGYPETPAKKIASNDRIYGVGFDRLALWVGDYEGPEYTLEEDDGMAVPDMAMSDKVEGVLAHHGVKGMKWGVRRADGSGGGGIGETIKKLRTVPDPQKVEVKAVRGQRVKATGGKHQEAHPDAIKTATSKQIAKASTTDALSTKDFQELVTRLNLEQQYAKLTVNDKTAVEKFIAKAKKDPISTAKNVQGVVKVGAAVGTAYKTKNYAPLLNTLLGLNKEKEKGKK